MKAQRARLPDSLQWLVDKVSPWGICKLMGIATKRGYRLEDVTNQCREQIAAANNGFAYLQGLLTLDKDWGFLAEQSRATEAAGVAAQEGQEKLRQAFQELEGRQFVGADGDVRKIRDGWVVVYSPEEAAKALGSSKGSSPISQSLLSAIDAGDLRPSTSTGSSARHRGGRCDAPDHPHEALHPEIRETGGATHAGAALAIALAGLQRAAARAVKL